MIYEYDVSIPANTLAAAPATVKMPIGKGIIYKLELQFLYGCRGYVFLQVKDAGLHQISPANPEGYHKAEGYVISFPMYYPVEQPPFHLVAHGWSPGTSFAHKVTVRIGVEPREVLEPARAEMGIVRRLGQLIFGGRVGAG